MPRRIDKLTKAQESRFPEWVDKWTKIGLQVGETDFDTFDKYMPICYEKAGIVYPKNVVRVSSPLVGALAASVAEAILRKRRDAVRDAVHGAVHDAVHGAVGDAVGGAVGGAVRDAVHGAVGGAVDDAVGDAVGTAITIAQKAGVSIAWHYWLGGQFWVGYWWYGVAVVSFFFDVCKLKLSKDIMERAEAYRKVSESVNYIWPNRDFVMVCARPTAIFRNEEGRLHCATGKAIEYPDGWGLYMLNGVTFPEELYWKVVKGEMPFKDILAIEDIDQRTQAMRFGDVWEFVKHSGAIKLDEHTKKRPDGSLVNYWLYEFPVGDIFTTKAYYAIYDDLVPGSTKQYMSGVPKSQTVAEALAWKFSDDQYLITPEQWMQLQPGISMN